MITKPNTTGPESHLRIVSPDVLDKKDLSETDNIESQEEELDMGNWEGILEGSDEPEKEKPQDPPKEPKKEVKKYSTPTPSGNTTLEPWDYQTLLEPLKDINPYEFKVLIKIRRLSDGRGCIASNKQISDYTNISYKTIKKIIPRLVKKGYLNVVFPGSKNRTLWCSAKLD